MSGYHLAHEVDQYVMNKDAMGLLMREAFFLALIGGFHLGSLGGGILVFLGLILFFGFLSRFPTLSFLLSAAAGVIWSYVLLQVAYAFGAGDFTAWVICIVAGVGACRIHNDAFAHQRILSQ